LKQLITKRLVDAIDMQDGAELAVWDTEVRGFGLRVRSSSKVYVLKYGAGKQGRWKRVTIGHHGSPWTPDTARTEAQRLLGLVAEGRDPANERDIAHELPTVREFAERYLRDHAELHKKPSSVEADRGLLGLREKKSRSSPTGRTILGAMGAARIDRVTRVDVTRLHLDWKDTPTRANRALALLSHMFNTAEKWGLRPDGSNPCRHVDRYRETRRERFLSDVELARLGQAIADLEQMGKDAARKAQDGKADQTGEPTEGVVSPFGLAAVRLLIFSGARASEVLGIRWDTVDMDTGRLLRDAVRLADSKTGAKTLYLNAPALAVLRDLPRVQGNPYAIVGGLQGEHLTLWGLEQIWQRVRKRAQLEDVHLHDLRHSFASAAAAGGDSLVIIGALLGHTQAATTQRYAHLSADPLRAASERTAKRLAAAMKPKPARKRKARVRK
jgi:integrase